MGNSLHLSMGRTLPRHGLLGEEWVFLMVQQVNNLSAMQEMQVCSTGWEDSLEENMATHSSIAWRIPRTEEPGRLRSMELQRVDMTEYTGLQGRE